MFAYAFVRFGINQEWACLFGGALLALIIGTRLYYPDHAVLARYDVLVIAALLLQAALLADRLETPEEARVILLFHVTGTVMEIFKTATGSWLAWRVVLPGIHVHDGGLSRSIMHSGGSARPYADPWKQERLV